MILKEGSMSIFRRSEDLPDLLQLINLSKSQSKLYLEDRTIECLR